LLSRQPQMGRSRFDLSPELRGFPVGSHLIFIVPPWMESKSSGFFMARGIFLNCLIDFFRVPPFHFAEEIKVELILWLTRLAPRPPAEKS
jgi:hypothetical protein